jgi:hypothetical protein
MGRTSGSKIRLQDANGVMPTATTLREKVMISYKKGKYGDLAGRKRATQVGARGAGWADRVSP